MSQWGKNDAASNSVSYAIDNLKAAGGNTSATQTTLFGNTTANAIKSNQTVGQFGVSAGEMRAARESGDAKPAHAGWNLRTVGSGGRAGRITYETLVAGGSITGDAEDTVFPDFFIEILTQPSATSANSTANEQATFTVVAQATPSTTLTYQWEANTGAGFANVDGIGGTSGNTTATLTVDANTYSNGDQFRVVVGATGANSVTSDAAVLTITT